MAIKKLIKNNTRIENGIVLGSILIGPYHFNTVEEAGNGEKNEAYFEIDLTGMTLEEILFDAAQPSRVTHGNNFRQFAEIRENGVRKGIDGDKIEQCLEYRNSFPKRNGLPVVKVDAKNPGSMEPPKTADQLQAEIAALQAQLEAKMGQ